MRRAIATEWVSAAEIAKRFGVHPATIRKWLRKNRFPPGSWQQDGNRYVLDVAKCTAAWEAAGGDNPKHDPRPGRARRAADQKKRPPAKPKPPRKKDSPTAPTATAPTAEETESEARARRMRAAADIEEIRRDEMAKLLLPVEDVERAAARQASIVRRRMDDMPMQLSALLTAAVGLGDDQTAQRAIRVEIERYVENLLRELAEESIADVS